MLSFKCYFNKHDSLKLAPDKDGRRRRWGETRIPYHARLINKSFIGRSLGTEGFRITPRVHEVRAPLETLAFLGRSNLVEPDEVSGGR